MTVTMEVTDKATGQTSQKQVTVDRDECNRPETTLEGLAEAARRLQGDRQRHGGQLVAVLRRRVRDRSSCRPRGRSALGIKPLGFFRGSVFAGCEADEMGIGPVFAVPKLLKRAGLTIDDIDIVELNEAFASQAVYCRDRLGISMDAAQPERRRDLDRPSRTA